MNVMYVNKFIIFKFLSCHDKKYYRKFSIKLKFVNLFNTFIIIHSSVIHNRFFKLLIFLNYEPYQYQKKIIFENILSDRVIINY